MKRFRCTVCNYIYDEEKEAMLFSELAGDWACPVCNAAKSAFVSLSEIRKEEPRESKTVSDVLIEQMAEWGIKFVFGIPGTSSLGLVDAIRKNEKLKYIQVRHEQTAAFMASAYGKLTGHIAACLTIAGPGATNLATGLYDAKLDHSPVLALTGLVKRQLIGPGSFQEIDQHSFFEPICVFNQTLMSEDQTTTLTTLAIKHALVDRGVSHISIPNDLQKLRSENAPTMTVGNPPDIYKVTEISTPFEYLIRKKDGSKMKPKIPSFDALIQNQGVCLATEGRSQRTIDWYASNLIRFLKYLRNR